MNSNYSQLLFTTIALLLTTIFGVWWFNPVHIADNWQGSFWFFNLILFILVSYVIWHPLIMEVLSWCISSHIKDIKKRKPVPGLKVAFITTIVPKNEPVELLHKCLPAMVNAKYKHDTWLLDEGNDEQAKLICKKYGVYHFSRLGISPLNTPYGKYTKTKGGNHNSWYDVFGKYYDFVAQIDTDFVPKKNFLTKTLGYFRDPKIAFVGTPQIYGNAESSLVARGASEQQLNFYGAILRGLSGMGMNLLIGANHIIRVKAFKKVNYYTAHLTEDLVTGMKLHANGWKSIYVPFPLAVGEGPATWESYFNQQLRWAYGCIDILFKHSFKHFKKMSLRQAVYYFFLQQHYFTGLAMALSIFLLSLYFLFGIRAADVDIFNFLVFYSLILVVSWLMSVWMQRYDVLRKSESKLFLAGKIISVAAWPVWFLAFTSIVSGKRVNYKVTPKGEKDANSELSFKIFLPHFIFAFVAFAGLITSFFTGQKSSVMIFWALSCIAVMLFLPFVDYIFRLGRKFIIRIFDYLGKLFTKEAFTLSERGNLLLPQIKSLHNQKLLSDCLFLSIVIITSISGYIDKIGFYSDDWSFLGNFTLSKDQSLMGLFQTATTPNTFMRPMQNLYDALLFYLFGLAPLGYHLTNSLVFVFIVILFYLILHNLKLPRIISLSGALIFALLPNYSTDRFWYASYQVNLSVMFFLLSTFTGLKALQINNKKTFLLKFLSIIFLILSALSYEIVLPLVFLNIILFWNPFEKIIARFNKKTSLNHHGVFITLNLLTLVYLVIFKAKTTIRLGDFNYPGDVIHLITEIFRVNFIELGLKLPLIWQKIFVSYFDYSSLILGATIFIISYLYLFLTFLNPKETLPSRKFLALLGTFGTFVFVLGYAIFFTNNRVGFSPTGIDNRVAIAASFGIALVAVSAAGFISKLFKNLMFSKWVFCFFISLISALSFMTLNTMALFWINAAEESRTILTDIKNNVPALPEKSTLILDGVCPYKGPAVVFESQWDLKGALEVIYKKPSIQADVVTPRFKIMEDKVQTQIYTFTADYPYKNLFVYNFKDKKTYSLENKLEADEYFRNKNPDFNNDCPIASAGGGVSIF